MNDFPAAMVPMASGHNTINSQDIYSPTIIDGAKMCCEETWGGTRLVQKALNIMKAENLAGRWVPIFELLFLRQEKERKRKHGDD